MEIAEIQARPREVRGTRDCRRLRRQGLTPAVLYGRGEPNVLLTLREEDVEHLVETHAPIVQVSWDGQQENAQIRDIQYDALEEDILHVDLVRISLTERAVFTVAVNTHGTAAGEPEGGVLELVSHEVEVECLPTEVPESITVEVDELDIGDNLTVGELAFPPGVTPVTDADTVVVTVVPPTEVEEEEVAPEELILEPEVIGEEVEEPQMPEELPEEPETRRE